MRCEDGPAGLEPGFRLRAQPASGSGVQATLPIDIGGSLRPVWRSGGTGLAGPTGRRQLRYANVSARDAGGRSLRANLSLAQGRPQLHVASTKSEEYVFSASDPNSGEKV